MKINNVSNSSYNANFKGRLICTSLPENLNKQKKCFVEYYNTHYAKTPYDTYCFVGKNDGILKLLTSIPKGLGEKPKIIKTEKEVDEDFVTRSLENMIDVHQLTVQVNEPMFV